MPAGARGAGGEGSGAAGKGEVGEKARAAAETVTEAGEGVRAESVGVREAGWAPEVQGWAMGEGTATGVWVTGARGAMAVGAAVWVAQATAAWGWAV